MLSHSLMFTQMRKILVALQECNLVTVVNRFYQENRRIGWRNAAKASKTFQC